jgi:hypothetical protein
MEIIATIKSSQIFQAQYIIYIMWYRSLKQYQVVM